MKYITFSCRAPRAAARLRRYTARRKMKLALKSETVKMSIIKTAHLYKGKEKMATTAQKVYFLFAVLISAFVIIFLPEFGNFSANASQETLQPETNDLLIQPSALITFTPSFTNFLPIVVKPPAAPSVSVVSSSAYDNGYGDLYVVGEIINNTSDNVTFVRVTATLHNSGGDVLRSDYSYVLIDVLAPGQKAPFKIYFSDYPTEYTTYQLLVTYSTTIESAKSDVSVLSSSTWASGVGSLYTAGEVRNNTGGSIEFVKVVVTYYDAAGTVTNVDYTYTDIDILGPGQKGPFKIFADDRPYNTYTFSVDYRTTMDLPPSGTSVTNLDIWTEFGSTRFTGEVQNDSSSNIRFVKVIATFYDNAGTVADVSSTYLPAEILGSSQKGCFKLYATDRPYNSYALVNDFSVTTGPLPSLEVLSITPSGDLHLAGQIRNNHATETYNFVKAVGTLYDGAGKVLNCESSYTSPSEIGPGEVAPYDINFHSHTSGWASYSVIATD